MKKYLFFSLFFISTALLYADLTDVYKKGPIKLTPDPEFGKHTDWKKLFPTPYKTTATTLKNIAVAKDGSIYVSNYVQYNIYKFDKDGNFIKQFGRKGSHKGDFVRNPILTSVWDDKYILVNEYIHGRLMLFDLRGKFIKALQVDYPVKDCLALNESLIAMAGAVYYKGGRWKRLVALKNTDTEKENILSYFMEDASKGTMRIKQKGKKGMMGFKNPQSGIRVFIERTPEGNLIAGYWHRPEITVYSPEGKRLKSFSLNIEPLKISDKARKEYYEGVEKTVRKFDLPEEEIEKILGREDLFPEHMPYFYDLMVDPEGNILVFIYTEEKDSHTFQVYSPEGKYICQSAIDPEDFRIKIGSFARSLVFSKGNLYALVKSEKAETSYCRLIRVKL